MRLLLSTLTVLVTLGAVNTAVAHGDPLPSFCAPVDNVCTTRLQSVTADVVNGTITGTPAGTTAPVTLTGQADAYLTSIGFGDARPDAVTQWDETIDRVNSSPDPNSYGDAKARAFLPRTLNGYAAQFPPNTLIVKFTSSDAGPFRLVSIQPTKQ